MMTMVLRSAVSALALACHTLPATGQVATKVEPGQTIRVERSGGERLIGIVRAPVKESALTLITARDRVEVVQLSDIRAVAVSRPRSTAAGLVRGAGVGFVVGGLAGAMLGLITGAHADSYLQISAGQGALLGLAAGGGAGAVVGGMIGAAAPGNTWQPVFLPVGAGLGRTSSGAIALVIALRH